MSPTSTRVDPAVALVHDPEDTPGTGRRPSDLTPAQVEQVGRELDAIREQVLASRGAADAAYIRRVIAGQRTLGRQLRALTRASPPADRRGAAGPSALRPATIDTAGPDRCGGEWWCQITTHPEPDRRSWR
jgi:hypothetical protein